MKKIYLIATVIAIIAGFATYFFATEIKENSSIKDVEKANVVVAMTDIPENTIITAEMLTVKSMPITTVTYGTVQNINDVVGMMTTQPISGGEQLVANKLIVVGDVSSQGALSYKLPNGRFAYAVNVDELQGICGFLIEGDYLNIYQIDTTKPTPATTLLLSHVHILKISNKAANDAKDEQGVPITSYSTLILDLDEKQFIKLSNAQISSTLRYVLVPFAEGEGIEGDLIEGYSDHTVPINEYNKMETTTAAAAE